MAGMSLLRSLPDREGTVRLMLEPIPILSGIMSYIRPGSLQFSSAQPYTYSAYGFISNKAAFPKASFRGLVPRIEGLQGTREPEQHEEYFVVVVDARRVFLYPVTGPSRAIGLSRDGVLVGLCIGWPDTVNEWAVVDLKTGDKTVCRWIPQDTKSVLAVAPDLETAVIRTSHAVTVVSKRRSSVLVAEFPKPKGLRPCRPEFGSCLPRGVAEGTGGCKQGGSCPVG
jgi:hypothetical protein